MRRVACAALPLIRAEVAGDPTLSSPRAALERVGEVALAFGPTVMLGTAGARGEAGVVWIEIGGCAHLHGGEESLAEALAARVQALGHACRVAIADGPRVASMVACFGARAGAGDATIIAAGQGIAALRALPVAALALDDERTQWLVDLGLATCGDLQRVPRGALSSRLDERAADVLALLAGDDRAPLAAWRPPEVPEEKVELEWPASGTEGLVFVVKTLCDRLAARLAGRGVGASRLAIVLSLDRAFVAPGADAALTVELALPGPIAKAADLLSVVRTRLDRVELPAPVLAVALRALDLAAVIPRPLDLLEPEPKAERALPRIAAELAADLGASRLGTLALVDTWAPDERTRLVPLGEPPSSGRRTRMVTSALEPSRLVAPVRLSIEAIARSTTLLLARFDGVQWWQRRSARRDFWSAWLVAPRDDREPPSALAWIEISPEGDGWLRGWMD
jgi:protein ImuB